MEARRRRGGKREKEVRRTSGREKSVLRRENLVEEEDSQCAGVS